MLEMHFCTPFCAWKVLQRAFFGQKTRKKRKNPKFWPNFKWHKMMSKSSKSTSEHFFGTLEVPQILFHTSEVFHRPTLMAIRRFEVRPLTANFGQKCDFLNKTPERSKAALEPCNHSSNITSKHISSWNPGIQKSCDYEMKFPKLRCVWAF